MKIYMFMYIWIVRGFSLPRNATEHGFCTTRTGRSAPPAVNDEILTGYSLASFLASEKCRKWSPDTRHCYTNCLQSLLAFVQRHGALTPELLADWRDHLSESYGRTTLNVHISAANNYFRWCKRYDLVSNHVKSDSAKDTPVLTRGEYLKLLRTARHLGERRSYLLIKLFVTADLPLQCLDQITVELVRQGSGMLQCRGTSFAFCFPAGLRKELLAYIADQNLLHGPVFLTRGGQPLNRANIFRKLQKLCQEAGVPEEKGNPRSMRNLYKSTQNQLDDRLLAQKKQMYHHLLEMEQDSIGW